MRRFVSALLPEWTDRNFLVILASRVAMSVGRAIAAIITSLYLASIGFTGFEIGALFVGVTITSALLSTAVGLFADRWGRKPFLIAIPLVTSSAAIIYSEVRAVPVLFAAAAVGSFGRGAGAGGGAGNIGPYEPAESALLAESTTASDRTSAFARLAFASTLGALAGGLLAEVVRTSPHMTAAQATAAYRPAFLLAAGLSAVAGLLGLLIEEPARAIEREDRPRRRVRWPRRSWPALWRLWTVSATNGAALGMFTPFVSYWMYRRYGVTPGAIGVLFAIIGAGSLVSTLLAARAARRLGTVRAIVVVRAFTGIILVPMVFAPTFWIAGAIYFVRMLVQRVGLPLRKSFTQEMADPEERASVAALSELPGQATTIGGQVTAGYLFDQVSLVIPFELAAAFLVVNAVLYGLLFSLRPPRAAAPAAMQGAEPLSAGADGGDPRGSPSPREEPLAT